MVMAVTASFSTSDQIGAEEVVVMHSLPLGTSTWLMGASGYPHVILLVPQP